LTVLFVSKQSEFVDVDVRFAKYFGTFFIYGLEYATDGAEDGVNPYSIQIQSIRAIQLTGADSASCGRRPQ
jgi:hypothetical protein